MDVSIIIVNYNTREYTLNCLRSVFEQTKDVLFEVILIDNASTDDSGTAVTREFPRVQFITNVVNIGCGSANNIGIRRSRGKYVFLLNSDTVLLNNAVKFFLDFMEDGNNGKIGCCGTVLLNEDRSIQASYGHFPSVRQVLFDQFELRRIFRKYYQENLAVASVDSHPAFKAVPYVSGAAMFFRRSALESAGVFDEDFFLYFEETELCFRMKRAEIPIAVITEPKIVHYFGKSSSGYSIRRQQMYKRSELLFFEKCYGSAIKYIVVSIYIVGSLIRLLLTWDRKHLETLKIILREIL